MGDKSTVTSANLGFPRIGANRELKWALEKSWSSPSTETFGELRSVAKDLRVRHWNLQRERRLGRIPVGDFSLYDHMLDMSLALGAVPERFGGRGFNPDSGDDGDLTRYFAMARGGELDGTEVTPLEMTKWFDTNYHYLVPELDPDQTFSAHSQRLVGQLEEANGLGVPARVVLVGPVTFLSLSKRTDGRDPVDLLDRMLPAYVDLIGDLRRNGTRYFQLDEPLLVTDLSPETRDAYTTAYRSLRAACGDSEVMLATYFGGLRENLALATNLPVDVLHVDLVRGAGQLDETLASLPESMGLSLGVVDGRNIWRSDLDRLIPTVATAVERIGAGRVQVAPTCSLLHLPVDLTGESALDPEYRSWLSFATERLDEVSLLALAVNGAAEADGNTLAEALEENRRAAASRRDSQRVHRAGVAERLAAVSPEMLHRHSPYRVRRVAQQSVLGLPEFPTTTIGSFPQTTEVRDLRRRFKRGDISEVEYNSGLRAETEACVREQEKFGLDVLVHGEFERTDMVEYFGEQMEGFFTTANGWVQSYGSRCVKPPVLFGDIVRPAPMTVEWTSFAASLTDRPMKGMLTGPVTILEWSFVRNDQPRSETSHQLALALRDEVDDLVAAGIRVIQIDEPALREGLPLRTDDRQAYLSWATDAFRLASSSVPDTTQIHTHMCYAEFGEIIDAIVDLDADVISMEASRSKMELLDDFTSVEYPNEIGPGIWDIHSPRVPDEPELDDLIARAAAALGSERLWINPDCGLKTRGWDETRASLAAMVQAAERARSSASEGPLSSSV